MPRNLKTLTIAEKQMVFKVVKSGRKKKELAEEFGIPDKTALFYKCMPDKTLTFKNEKRNGSKHSKERLTLLLAVNMTDYCSAHNIIPTCQAVKVKFLSPNTTSKLQPLDQGIIKTFTTLYKKEIVRKIISDMDDEKSTAVDILQAMRIVDKIWRNVTTTTIVNCFRSCGFVLEAEKDGT
ncbi:tigger transposable element-derived protein 6-like [Sipha flava]|uniref:Tigger transposable element-derived protein 6-like n=1 Tax=Sipha flava TaxID=143950 RepID=A0A8B8FK09_9HEMI|nr:tigger transposable element-derived protein 6-like [Sipha flava]